MWVCWCPYNYTGGRVNRIHPVCLIRGLGGKRRWAYRRAKTKYTSDQKKTNPSKKKYEDGGKGKGGEEFRRKDSFGACFFFPSFPVGVKLNQPAAATTTLLLHLRTTAPHHIRSVRPGVTSRAPLLPRMKTPLIHWRSEGPGCLRR